MGLWWAISRSQEPTPTYQAGGVGGCQRPTFLLLPLDVWRRLATLAVLARPGSLGQPSAESDNHRASRRYSSPGAHTGHWIG